MDKSARIYVAGHRGLIGSAFVRRLQRDGYRHLLLRSRAELDLEDRAAVDAFFDEARPDIVVLAAGKVGGILENTRHPADFLTANLRIQVNVLTAARRARSRQVFFFGSSCMYPRDCPQPMAEDRLMAGTPEPTSMPYAIAKLAGVQMCLAFNRQFPGARYVPVIPNNAYGPNDNFDLESSHVLAALIRKFDDAKARGGPVTLWGSGTPRREFIHADDIADACLFLMDAGTEAVALPLNVGSGSDCSIRELAQMVARAVGYDGRIEWDASRPDGAPRKLLDSSRLRSLGWAGPRVALPDGIAATYHWYRNRQKEAIRGAV